MSIMNYIKSHKYLLLLVAIAFAIVLLWSQINSFSEDTTSSAWDGVVAKSFTSGTGTVDNPYIISNASEFAYFKELLEGEDALVYVDKNYKIINSFNYGENIASINNEIPFSGSIDGTGITIDNIIITNYLFNTLKDASIKNIKFNNVIVNVDRNTGIISNTMENSELKSLIINGNVNKSDDLVEDVIVTGIAYSDNASSLENVIINITDDVTGYLSLINDANDTIINNVLVKKGYNHLNNDSLINISKLYEFSLLDNEIVIDDDILNNFTMDEYSIIIDNNDFVFDNNSSDNADDVVNQSNDEIPLRSLPVSIHDTGVDGDTVYINDITADYNYYTAMDYTYFVDTGTIPDFTRINKYNDDDLVKVYIKYSGTDINGDYTGKVSLTEDYSNFVYYKYYPVVNGYVTIELIDNPYANRPNDKVFMGWITDYENAQISIDMDTYLRYVKIPVSDVSSVINITMYALWGEGSIYEMTSSRTIYAVRNNFSTGMNVVNTNGQYKDYGNITNFSEYFTRGQINYNRRFTAGTFDEYLNVHSGSRTDVCTNRNGCYYYTRAAAAFDDNAVYYVLDSVNGASLLPYTIVYDYPDSMNMSGYFIQNSVRRGNSIDGMYDNSGTLQSGNCSTTNCTVYELVQYYDGNGNQNFIDRNQTYYYLSTRDTNILVLRASVNTESTGGFFSQSYYYRNTVPLTITGINNGNNYVSSAILDINNAYYSASADLRIEYVTVDSGAEANADTNASNSLSSANIYGNYYNVKIGRGIEHSDITDWFGRVTGSALVAKGAYAGNVSEVSDTTKYTFIVESGTYNILGATGAAVAGGTDVNVAGRATWGNDLDRIRNNNTNLDVYFSTAGNWGGDLRSDTTNSIAVLQLVKSGTFGSSKNSYDCGIYSGGRGTSGSSHYAARSTIVEGGEIYNLIGGPFTASNRTNVNDTYLYVKGGSIDMIIGGAGLSTTYGNRIIAVTGGTVKYGVFGGSNGSSSTGENNQTGEVFGSSFVYIGGTAYIGGGNTEGIFGVLPGGVFGAGNGVSGMDQVGSVNNSNILINGGTIAGNVYGGGNFGATGYALTNGTTATTIKMLSGIVNGSIYGGGNNNGSGKDEVVSSVNIDIAGGTVNTSVFGGSKTKGKIYGSTNVTIDGGTIVKNVYGGGEGGYHNSTEYGTYVRDNVNVVVNNGNINGSVYGGSAFGTVNAINENTTSSSFDTTVTVNGGVITNSVFGGGQGGSLNNVSYTPQVVGDITVTINDGDITSVFGGNDQAGIHNKNNEVYLNGGIIDAVYGGGNKSSVTNTNVYLNGSTVTNIYGGSNTLGDVSTTNIDVNAGTIHNIYGGNNEGGSCGITDVNVTGTAIITGSIYGGGNQVDTTTTTVTLNSANGTVPNVFGGGNSASVTTTNIIQNGVSITNIYGGSNSLGTVNESNISFNNGTTTNVYGGNNEGGNTLISNIDVHNGTITSVYGGGNQANGDESNIDISGGTITNVFGGGNSAGLTESNVNVTNGIITTIYGGSNNSGGVTTTNILINGNAASVDVIYGGGNKAEVGDTNITVNNGTITTVYGGGNLAQVTGDTVVDINGGLINSNIYGGGNYGVVKGDSNVTVTDATILGSAYAGGNGITATLEGNTNITIDGNTVIGTINSVSPTSGCVFGGGNQAYTGIIDDNDSSSNVNIVGGTIYGNVYGGANTSVIYGNTIVNIGKTAYTSNDLSKTDIYIKGNVFGGGEANASGSEIYDWSFISVTESVNITIDADTYTNFKIDGSFFGGGNASSATGDSYLLIRNYGVGNNPKRNISIQRVTYVTIDNSSILLKGAIDRANDYDKEHFSISRVIDFKLQNNSYLFLETGANLLEKFQSLDNNGNLAVVNIDEDNNTLTKTVDNRIYMYEGKNLNIAKDQQVTEYGDVLGMSFLGIFNYDNDRNVNTGNYSNVYEPGDTLDWAGTFNKGSYVLGKHLTNHNIKINGFYSNFMDEETLNNEVRYIDPTPKDALFYMWYIGENVLSYDVNLVASKYSTLGSVELSFLEFSKPNTSFQILSFDSSEIAEGVSLIDKNDIPRIANNLDDANNKFGLTMEASNSGWLTTGKTSFYTREPAIDGVTYYEGENSTVVPTMLFYLYHSKNLSEEKDLGTVKISIMAITKLNALSNEVKRLVVNVNMSSALFQTIEYEGAMTPGDKYELFTSTSNNITTKSKISAYYGLYGNGNLYQTGYHRVLTSSYILPVGTKITMLDFAAGSPEYYYHVIDNNDFNHATNEFNVEGECSYALSLFTKMGSLNNNSNYDDASKNNIYYDGNNSSEELIFIVDFSNTEINENKLNNTLLIEIRDANEESIISVLGIQHAKLTYNLYANMDSEINVQAIASDNPLYIGYNNIFDVSTTYQNSSISGISIIDTQYFDSKMGIQIYLTNNEGNVVSGTDLTGAYFLMDGVRYYPDISGYTHIKLANKVGNTKKWITFNTENANIATGDYTFTFEAFASADGIYYIGGNPDYCNVDMTIINSSYGLKPEIDEDTVIFSANNDKSIKFKTNYQSLLDNPNIRIAMYRRKYDEINDTNYELVDLQDFVLEALVTTNNEYEYLLVNQPSYLNTFTYQLNSELLTGTYRLSFRLYDGNTFIGEINKYIVIK